MPTTAAFTICTNCYLPQALALAESMALHAPDWKFFICLVDTKAKEISYSFGNAICILTADDIHLPCLKDMASRYNIIELCTALKPSFFKHIFKAHPEIDIIHYLDPDICVFNGLQILDSSLANDEILLTPHALSSIPLDGKFPDETLFLNHGIYNLGYIGIRRGLVSTDMLNWWEARMEKSCVIDLINGLFVDQLWCNLVPIIFPSVRILREPGANMAFWNFHERFLDDRNQIQFQGKCYPLYFFHFSGFNPLSPESITKVPSRMNDYGIQQIHILFSNYADTLLRMDYKRLSKIKPYYTVLREREQAIQRQMLLFAEPKRYILSFLRCLIPDAFKKWLRS